jgi:hypothetical protein
MTSADVQRLERGFASTTRANANSSVQPSELSNSATVRANAAATEGLALCGMESNTGQFSAAISRIGGSGDRSAPGRGTAAGGAVGTWFRRKGASATCGEKWPACSPIENFLAWLDRKTKKKLAKKATE